ncbi:cupin domain-containing protein [Limisphaera sp. VF-2]|jgi:dTDP-4-dehydrorhamnose 3,5-epimerase-like enzyme|uniref:polysaccharide biosynthesis C-terminal domain-containing protein n=1 Tax=Limisphaera sp. VF-2 TaxID=3400418 RepID=UPI0030A6965F
MEAQVSIEPLRLVRDVRGWVVEPVDERHLAGLRNVHVVWTEPGHVRGNHYHRETTEILLVVGPARVRWVSGGAVQELMVAEGEARRLVFPPGVAHAIQNIGTRPMVLASFTDRPHDPQQPDTVRVDLIVPQEGAVRQG